MRELGIHDRADARLGFHQHDEAVNQLAGLRADDACAEHSFRSSDR